MLSNDTKRWDRNVRTTMYLTSRMKVADRGANLGPRRRAEGSRGSVYRTVRGIPLTTVNGVCVGGGETGRRNCYREWYNVGRAIAQAVSRWLLTEAARVWQVGFVVDKVESGQVFSEYFGFSCQNHSFHQLLHPHNHPGQLAEALRRADHPSKDSCRLS
jgi:hypothetical protein